MKYKKEAIKQAMEILKEAQEFKIQGTADVQVLKTYIKTAKKYI